MSQLTRNLSCFVLFLYLSLLPQFISTAVLHSLDSLCEKENSGPVQFGTAGSSSFGTVSLTKTGSYLPGVNCTVKLEAPQGYLLHLAFSEISTRGCELDYVNVRYGNNETRQLCGYRHCPSEDCNDLDFDAKNIVIQFVSNVNGTVNSTYKGFQGMVTVFSSADSHGNCHTTEQYRCRNRHCIWKGLYCNGHNHCGDKSDEPAGCTPFAQQAIWGILVIAFGAVSFCVFLPLFCYFAMRGQRRMVINHSPYQPLPTSINDRETTHFTAALDYNAKYYSTGLVSSNSADVGVHSKAGPQDYDQEYKSYH